MNIDPLAAKYPYNSTYAFSENKVVMYNELEGLETGPAYWMVYTPTAKSAGVTPTTWNKLYQRNEAPSQAEATIVDITPVVGDAKGFVETFTGSDLMTGEKLGWGSRVLGLFMLSEFRVAGKVGDVFKSGKWIDTGENMSDAASSFQKQITGVDASQSFKLNGVKFDGITDSGVLLDAKSGMGNFVGKDGNFKNWFKGADSLIDQANRQLKAADGIKIQWHFENKKVMEATQKLFKKNDIEGIELIHTPRK
ncbi:hypothetical protein H9X54_002470 [Flavobacterium macrobrachii]|uniref:Tox-REase-5 domain-containing protein n=2 Tax=Flavobacterium macrobrachii TaxID=591204 RepID=A0ABS2CVA6_9FLAO|nr:hypothetical protein [Flavobacterium macrobrachii]